MIPGENMNLYNRRNNYDVTTMYISILDFFYYLYIFKQ